MSGGSLCRRLDVVWALLTDGGEGVLFHWWVKCVIFKHITRFIMKPESSTTDLQRLLYEQQERLKELSAINQTTAVIKEGKPVAETLQQICMIIPPAWQYPDYTVARIRYAGEQYTTSFFEESGWVQKQVFKTIDDRQGVIEVYYTRSFVVADEGPFLNEERHLLNNMAELITGFLNSRMACELLSRRRHASRFEPEITQHKGSMSSRKLLQQFLNKANQNRYLYHDLMPFKVKEILLVANLYDAFSIEREGRFSEHVLGEYAQMSLTSIPRITGVSTPGEAMEQLRGKHFDMVILMMGADKRTPIGLSCSIKEEFEYIPVFLLLNNNGDMALFEQRPQRLRHIDRVFIWNGDPRMFFAMIKLVEDSINVENDTRIGMVRVIVLVEDTPKYYSRYLPMLYNIVMEQTRRIIDDVSTDELYRVLRLRARPKLLLVNSYEEAQRTLMQYKDYLLCLITDVKFPRGEKMSDTAGFDLTRMLKAECPDTPVVIQSLDRDNAHEAWKLKATFINKDSETLVQDFKSFITYYLGFGNFIYRNSQGMQITVARSLKEFEHQLRVIPEESLLYHARKDHFSLWLMARGEVQAARVLSPSKVTDFDTPGSLRKHLLEVISTFRNEQNSGRVIPYEESAITDEHNILLLSSGSLGGKGRGLAFINTLIHSYDFSELVPDIRIRMPKTSIIGTGEFEYFMERNHLNDVAYGDVTYDELKKMFVAGRLSDILVRRLRGILTHIVKPLAVRSSGLFEDSLMQPFAGIFETYVLPNSHGDIAVRLQQLCDAVKLVFASVFSDMARGYVEAVHYKVEEEKMAVVIQELVGEQYEHYYYPHISGVAQSYNYYPYASMRPEEGVAVAALGLGKYVVEGEKAWRFSPRYPDVSIVSAKDQYKYSQVEFLAVEVDDDEPDLLQGDMAGLVRLDLDDAERHGVLRHLASVYDMESHRILPGVRAAGPRIINFANILKYHYVPLAETIGVVLDVVQEALGSAVEIEYAVDLNKDRSGRASFHLLQIKPLLGGEQDFKVARDEKNNVHNLLYSERCMGNGLIDDICDVIFVDRERFDKSKTVEMAAEIAEINKEMVRQGKKYILIGPGRWGTRDRWIGIPVKWPQISHARVIVETSMEGYPLDASSGSHFFHNVTSMNVAYLSVQPEKSGSYLRYEILEKQPVIKRAAYFNHVCFKQPVVVKIDGKKRIAIIATGE